MCPAFQVVHVAVAVRWELVNGVEWNGRRRLHAKLVDGRRLSAHGLSDHLFEVLFLVVYGVHESPRCLLWWCDQPTPPGTRITHMPTTAPDKPQVVGSLWSAVQPRNRL